METLGERVFRFLVEYSGLCKSIAGEFPEDADQSNAEKFHERFVTYAQVVLKKKKKTSFVKRLTGATENTTTLLAATLDTFKHAPPVDTVWPSGDYATWGDMYNQFWGDHDSDYTLKGKRVGYIDNPVGFGVAIFQSFVVPYIYALIGARLTDKTHLGVFVFIYEGGGAGCFVRENGNAYAVSAGHCFYLNKTYKDKRKQYIVMGTNSQLYLLNAPCVYDANLDYGIATVKTNQPTEVATLGPTPKNGTRIQTVGSPSSRGCHSYCVEDVYVPAITTPVVPFLHQHHVWLPFFFHKQTGKITKVGKTDFYHTATVWAGMSGGPVYVKGKVVGIHTGFDDYAGGTAVKASVVMDAFREQTFQDVCLF
jgi:hypothetical protein